MLRKIIFSFSTVFLCLAHGMVSAQSQPCATTQHHAQQVQQHPGIIATQVQLEHDIDAYVKDAMANRNGSTAAKGTNAVWEDYSGYTTDLHQFNIPVVVHIVHNYGTEYITDNQVYEMVQKMTVYYNKRNPDTSVVVPLFKEYIGNARINFYLATKDPEGRPTIGITRHYSYTTYGGDEYAKTGQWPANRYLNIWVENRVDLGGGVVAAYSRFPADGKNNPYGDGVITRADAIGSGLTIEHEIGHYFNLLHVWSSSGAGACALCGDDAVDDTPPTKGHYWASCPGCPQEDTVCALGYKKSYMINGLLTTVDFPDTANTQNIMDYSDCRAMFTIGQVMRMRAALYSPATDRSKLASKENLLITGIWSDSANGGTLAPRPDLAPIADFSVNRNFVCPNTSISLTNRTWRDTANVAWALTNGIPATSTANSNVTASFTQPGWAKISLTATSNAGTNTLERSDLVYVASPDGIPAEGYYQEFTTGGDADQFPIFNYYHNNDHKWQIVHNAGYYDQSSIRFYNYDPRAAASVTNQTQTPQGNFADFFTRAFDLSGATFTSNANLLFYSSGASRAVNPSQMNDSLLISYSTDCGATWVRLSGLTKGDLANAGLRDAQFTPSGMSDWRLNNIALPAIARTARVFFRFRFYNGSDNGASFGYQWGNGNHLYLDRIGVSGNAVSVNNIELAEKGISVTPNPTHGVATISLKGGDNSVAHIRVTDITGKLVYSTELSLTSAVNSIDLPADSIAAKGIYMIHAVSNGISRSSKLVVY